MLLLIGGCSPRDARRSLYPSGSENYRLLRDTDLCSELPIFADRDPKSMIGTILDGAKSYRDPRTGLEFRAIRVLTFRGGQRVKQWYPRNTLVGRVFILRNDPTLGNCSYWLEVEQDAAQEFSGAFRRREQLKYSPPLRTGGTQ